VSGWAAVEWAGSIGGAAGALVLALNVPWGGWAFVIMFAFTGLLLVSAIARRRAPYAVLFLAYEGVNLIGIYRWLLAA
jgi:hypothetical protein